MKVVYRDLGRSSLLASLLFSSIPKAELNAQDTSLGLEKCLDPRPIPADNVRNVRYVHLHIGIGIRTMTRLTTTEIRERLSEALNQAAYRGERIVLTRHGKDIAALISAEDLALLEELEDHLDNQAAREALAEKGKNVPWEKLKKELGL